MGFDYLFGKNWKGISRDERRFCAGLIFQLETNKTQANFVKWIIEQNNLDIKNQNDFEIDFEVYFYRDLIFEYEMTEEKPVNLRDKDQIRGLMKRTFDICIFLPNDIIIIEAKAAKGMTTNQMIEFKYDKLSIKCCLKELGLPDKKVHVIGLISAQYNQDKIGDLNKKYAYFDGVISWKDIESNHELGYIQPEKLTKVYLETNDRDKKKNIKVHDIISQLSQLTESMHKELHELKKPTKLKANNIITTEKS